MALGMRWLVRGEVADCHGPSGVFAWEGLGRVPREMSVSGGLRIVGCSRGMVLEPESRELRNRRPRAAPGLIRVSMYRGVGHRRDLRSSSVPPAQLGAGDASPSVFPSYGLGLSTRFPLSCNAPGSWSCGATRRGNRVCSVGCLRERGGAFENAVLGLSHWGAGGGVERVTSNIRRNR